MLIIHILISLLIFTISFCILDATRIKIYLSKSKSYTKLVKDEKFPITIYLILILLLFSSIPIMNIVLFLTGYVIYSIYYNIDPYYSTGISKVIYLEDSNIISKFFIKYLIK